MLPLNTMLPTTDSPPQVKASPFKVPNAGLRSLDCSAKLPQMSGSSGRGIPMSQVQKQFDILQKALHTKRVVKMEEKSSSKSLQVFSNLVAPTIGHTTANSTQQSLQLMAALSPSEPAKVELGKRPFNELQFPTTNVAGEPVKVQLTNVLQPQTLNPQPAASSAKQTLDQIKELLSRSQQPGSAQTSNQPAGREVTFGEVSQRIHPSIQDSAPSPSVVPSAQLETDDPATALFRSLESIQTRRNLFRANPSAVPRQLDPEIESYFTNKQQKNRLKMFQYLTDSQRGIAMEETVVKSAQKVNHGRFHNKYRGSIYRGVSRNGKAWQILIMIDTEKIYLCTTNDPDQAAQLYDVAIVQAKGLSSKVNFKYSKDELLAMLFERSIVQVKKEKVEHDQVKQRKLFGVHQHGQTEPKLQEEEKPASIYSSSDSQKATSLHMFLNKLKTETSQEQQSKILNILSIAKPQQVKPRIRPQPKHLWSQQCLPTFKQSLPIQIDFLGANIHLASNKCEVRSNQ